MEPVQRDDHNYVYKGEHVDETKTLVNEGVGDLSCRVEDAYVYAHFRPSAEELALLNEGGVVELHIVGHPIPPVGLDVVRDAPRAPKAEDNGNLDHG